MSRVVAGVTTFFLAAFVSSSCGDEAGWRCCQTTAFTCVCSQDRACAADAVVEACSVEELGTDEAYCCHHTNIASCSCSENAEDISGEPVCSREGDRRVQDCSAEPTEGGGGAAQGGGGDGGQASR